MSEYLSLEDNLENPSRFKRGCSASFQAEHKCLVCLDPATQTPFQVKYQNPLDQFKILLRVLRISSRSFEDSCAVESLPDLLFCSPCTKRILDALQIVLEIEYLQSTLDEAAKVIHEDLISSFVTSIHQDDELDGTLSDVQSVRKTLTQCFSRCKVTLAPVKQILAPASSSDPLQRVEENEDSFRIKEEPHGDERRTDELVNFLTPVTILRNNEPRSEDEQANLTGSENELASDVEGLTDAGDMDSVEDEEDNDSDEYVLGKQIAVEQDSPEPSEEDESDSSSDEDSKPVPPEPPAKRAKRTPRGRSTRSLNTTAEVSNEEETPVEAKLGTRNFEDGKLTSYDCPYCQRTFSRSEYMNTESKYVFKCVPECCDKVTANFPNLIYHHEANCPSKPSILKRKKKKNKYKLTPNEKKVYLQANPPGVPNPRNGLVYNTEGRVFAFECQRCPATDKADSYLNPATSEYEFKCAVGGCGKITTNFTNLAFHHPNHCSKTKPRPPTENTRKAYKTPKSELQSDCEGLPELHDENSFADGADNEDNAPQRAKVRTSKSKSSKSIKRRKITTPQKKSLKPSKSKKTPATPKVQSQEPVESKFGTRHFVDGQIMSFDCTFCLKTLSRNDYCTEAGNYVFQCFPECCQRITTNFSNLIYHHESSCPSKPAYLISPKKRRKVTKKFKVTQGQKLAYLQANPPGVPNARNGLVYNSEGRVASFECQRCPATAQLETFMDPSTGAYLFKCSVEDCEKVTDNFTNLMFHHGLHCPKTKPRPEDGTSKTIFSEKKNTGRKTENGRTYNPNNRLIAYECPRCEKSYKPSDFEQEAGPEENSLLPPLFKCQWEHCSKVCGTFPRFVNHHESHCEVIKQTVTHLKFAEGKLVGFQCLVCNKDILTVPGQKNFKCDYEGCVHISSTFSKLRSHHETHCSSVPVDSEDTNPVNPGYIHIIRQSKDQKKGKVYAFYCELCGKGYDRKDNYDNHISFHMGTLVYQCTHCARRFTSEANLTQHLRYHDIRPQDRRLLNVQSEVLEQERKTLCPKTGVVVAYHCPGCDKTLSKSECSTTTTETPEQKKVFKCPQNCCERTFKTFALMLVHHVTNCPEPQNAPGRSHTCTQCNLTFGTKTLLNGHWRRAHRKRDPLYCDQCGKAFFRNYDLKRHMIYHTQEKAWPCDQCPKAYRAQKELKEHQLLHVCERPHMCTTCGKTFRYRSSLIPHEKSHILQDCFCSLCEKPFKSQQELHTHMGRKHRAQNNNNPGSSVDGGSGISAAAGAAGTNDRVSFEHQEAHSSRQQHVRDGRVRILPGQSDQRDRLASTTAPGRGLLDLSTNNFSLDKYASSYPGLFGL